MVKSPRGEWFGARGRLLTMGATLNTSEEALQIQLPGNKIGVSSFRSFVSRLVSTCLIRRGGERVQACCRNSIENFNWQRLSSWVLGMVSNIVKFESRIFRNLSQILWNLSWKYFCVIPGSSVGHPLPTGWHRDNGAGTNIVPAPPALYSQLPSLILVHLNIKIFKCTNIKCTNIVPTPPYFIFTPAQYCTNIAPILAPILSPPPYFIFTPAPPNI